MTPETEVIACPACRHLVRVPLDWLGTQVQCPECKSMFRAPVRAADGKLTDPELISRPAPAGAAPARKLDVMLLLPAFGLLFCGVAGTIANGFFLYVFVADPAGADGWAKAQMPALRQMGFGTPGTPEEQAAEDERNAAQLARTYKWLIPLSLAVSVVVFAGGVAIVCRRGYRLAQFACVLAALNLAHFCCLPGAVAGLWGLLMLTSDEGREHFLT